MANWPRIGHMKKLGTTSLAGAVGGGAEFAGEDVALQLVSRLQPCAVHAVDRLTKLVHAQHRPALNAAPAGQAAVAPLPNLQQWSAPCPS